MRLAFVLPFLLPTSADAFIAQNGMHATQISPTEIAVDFRPSRYDTDYWCAAGDYAQRVLNLPVDTRLWRASPKPRKAGQGIIFTLNSANKSEGAGLSQFGSGPRDGSMSLGMAVAGYCRIVVPFWSD